ncbi:MAG TPA: DUF3592 domain-containing protein [Candidatus Sumerlaeota bacterium]|nr:DUF3592 domain-containing protein [Candidatus Sumerlaeota bacterium]HPS01912.1 DUF3592 domain-containing protein [Candidatus Sumerlaeota bacterium]
MLRRIFWILFPFVFIAVGALIVQQGLQERTRARASAQWPTAQGTITESSLERRSSGSGNRRSTSFYANVRYAFSVDGQTFTGNRVAYGDYGSSFSSHAQGLVDRYPKGRNVTVSYMPGNPTESLLEPGAKTQVWFLPGMGALFFMAGCLVAMQRLRARR